MKDLNILKYMETKFSFSPSHNIVRKIVILKVIKMQIEIRGVHEGKTLDVNKKNW